MRLPANTCRLWLAYSVLLICLAWAFFGELRHLPLDTHDADTFRDNLASGLLARTSYRLGLVGGLLPMANTAHFQAVHHISALNCPLALLCVIGSVLCHLRYLQARRRTWLVAFGVAFLLGVGSHLAGLAVLPFCLYLSWHRGQNLKAALLPLLPGCAVADVTPRPAWDGHMRSSPR